MNILFVCTGNTCRSAMAEWLLKKMLKDKNLKDIEVSSCGIATLPSFKVPVVVLYLMKDEGVDISKHRSRQISKEIIDNSDLILAMDQTHKEYIDHRFPESKAKAWLLKEYRRSGTKDLNIADPIGQEEGVYLKTKEEIKNSLNKLINILEDEK